MLSRYSKFKWASLSFVLILSVACAREPRHKEHRLGEVFSISPVAVNFMLAPTPAPSKALKLNVMWGGRAITSDKGDSTLNFYDKNNKLLHSKKWSELSESHKSTSCSDEQVATMDGYLMGVALICDRSLELKDVQKIEAVNAKGERRSATSWGVYSISDEVDGVSLGLY